MLTMRIKQFKYAIKKKSLEILFSDFSFCKKYWALSIYYYWLTLINTDCTLNYIKFNIF